MPKLLLLATVCCLAKFGEDILNDGRAISLLRCEDFGFDLEPSS